MDFFVPLSRLCTLHTHTHTYDDDPIDDPERDCDHERRGAST